MADDEGSRRDFLKGASSWLMAGGLLAGYGGLAYVAGRFLYAPNGRRAWLFVADVAALAVGEALPFQAPDGTRVLVARQHDANDADAFIALSSICPHLGCAVHWQGHLNRFFCPCHNGVFDALGRGIAGPPGKAGQSLPRYPLKVDKGLLFIEVPTSGISGVASASAALGTRSEPGHDSCLGCPKACSEATA